VITLGVSHHLKEGAAVRKLLLRAPIHREATMANDEGTKAAGKRWAASTAGVTATAVALFAAAIFLGSRHAGDAGPLGGPAPPVARAALPSAPPAATAPPAAGAPPLFGPHRPPRHLQQVNRHELESTLPQGAWIDVTAMDGDPEALGLAREIRAFLLANGYQVGEVTRSISTPPAKGVGLQPLDDGKWRVIVGNAEE
jgi:hypothetical protein